MQNQPDENPHPLAENAPDMVCLVGLDLVKYYVSPACERLLGWKPEEMVGRGAHDFVHPDDLPATRAVHEALIRASIDLAPHEVRMLCKDGSYARMEMSGRLVFPPGATAPSALVLVLRDISGRERNGLELEYAQEQGFRKAFSMTPIPMVIATLPAFRIRDVNDAFTSATAYAAAELRGRAAREIPLFDEAALRSIETALANADGVRNIELGLHTRHGTVVDCLVSVQAVSAGAHPSVLAIFQDVSERKRSEAELKQAIESVMEDASWFSRAVVERLARLRQPRRVRGDDTAFADLTPREREVLGLMCEGQTDDEIAVTLGVSRNTVRNHISKIYAKIGVHRRAGAIVWARERGILGYDQPKKKPRARR